MFFRCDSLKENNPTTPRINLTFTYFFEFHYLFCAVSSRVSVFICTANWINSRQQIIGQSGDTQNWFVLPFPVFPVECCQVPRLELVKNLLLHKWFPSAAEDKSWSEPSHCLLFLHNFCLFVSNFNIFSPQARRGSNLNATTSPVLSGAQEQLTMKGVCVMLFLVSFLCAFYLPWLVNVQQ